MDWWRRTSIAIKLPVAAGALLLLVVGAQTVGAYGEVRRSAVAVAGQRLEQVTEELAGRLETSAEQRFVAVRAAADEPAIVGYLRVPGPGTATAASATIEDYAGSHSSLRTVELWDATGERVLVAGRDLPPLAPAVSRALIGSIADGPAAGMGPFHVVSDTVMFPVIAPVSGEGSVVGYLVERRAQASSPESVRQLTELIGADARMLFGSEGSDVWTDLSTGVPGPGAPLAAGVSGAAPVRYTGPTGEAVFARAARVASTPWLVVVELPASPVLAPARRFLGRALLASLVLTGLGMAAAWGLSRRLTRPLEQLTAAAESLAAGLPAAAVEVDVDRADELGRLATSFNAMAAQVEQSRRELEDRVAERTAALEAANRELEAFSYSVSHDLRAPLRAIDGFSRILLTDHAAELSPDARGVLDVIVRNSKQMGRLIDDLLTFSRISRQQLTWFSVDMTALAEAVAEEARSAEPERRIEIAIERLPAAHGERALLQQVLANVIQNAVKFTRTRDPARIEVGHRDEGGEVVYYVKDNGVGFDMRYVDKLFGVFERLHRAEDFEGTGVGLAIVQRIVHRHGGRVWAEAEEDRGATFHFTIPGTNDDAI